MLNEIFFLPKEVLYCCLIAVIIIFACIIFAILYRSKKGTYYYVFTINYFFQIAGLLLCILLIPMLFGYSIATMYTVYINKLVIDQVYSILLYLMPIIPLIAFVWLLAKFKRSLDYKKQLDENL